MFGVGGLGLAALADAFPFPIARAKLNANQLKVLKIISESIYAIKDAPPSADSKLVEGSITRVKLLKKLGWDNNTLQD
jgi:hypothetical protein